MLGNIAEHEDFIGGHLFRGRQRASENRGLWEKNHTRGPRKRKSNPPNSYLEYG